MSRTDCMREHFERLLYNARSPQEATEIMREYQNVLARERHEMLRLPPPIFYPSNPFTSPGGASVAEKKAESQKPLPEEHIVSAVSGYRAWNVPLFVDELRSVNQNAKWKPFERYEASCSAAQCSGVSCSCGIYAFNKMALVQKEYMQTDRSKRYVYGECWLWGRVLECKDGYRAQFAYPKALVNNGAIAKRMAEVFGVKLL